MGLDCRCNKWRKFFDSSNEIYCPNCISDLEIENSDLQDENSRLKEQINYVK